jgi:hypothetical protein
VGQLYAQALHHCRGFRRAAIAHGVAQDHVGGLERSGGLLRKQARQVGEVALHPLLGAASIGADIPDRRAHVDGDEQRPQADQRTGERDAG